MRLVLRPLSSAAILVGALAVAPSAWAQDSAANPPANAPAGRYAMTPAPDGFLRLDTQTGAVSLCRPGGDGVVCRAAAEERGALEQEIERLGRENADLRRKLAAATDQAPSARLRNALPTEEEVNGALSYMERFMRRMMRVLRDEQPSGDRI